MKIRKTILCVALVLSTTSFVMAAGNGVPENPVLGTPGNSGAGQEVLPDSQPNCLGARVSDFVRTEPGAGGQNGRENQGAGVTGVIGNNFLLGSVIGVLPDESCEDFVAP